MGDSPSSLFPRSAVLDALTSLYSSAKIPLHSAPHYDITQVAGNQAHPHIQRRDSLPDSLFRSVVQRGRSGSESKDSEVKTPSAASGAPVWGSLSGGESLFGLALSSQGGVKAEGGTGQVGAPQWGSSLGTAASSRGTDPKKRAILSPADVLRSPPPVGQTPKATDSARKTEQEDSKQAPKEQGKGDEKKQNEKTDQHREKESGDGQSSSGGGEAKPGANKAGKEEDENGNGQSEAQLPVPDAEAYRGLSKLAAAKVGDSPSPKLGSPRGRGSRRAIRGGRKKKG